jgi:hypothetical protein
MHKHLLALIGVGSLAFAGHHYSTKAPKEPRLPRISMHGVHAGLHIAPLHLTGGHIGGRHR